MKKNTTRGNTSTLSIALIFPLLFAACSSGAKGSKIENGQEQTEETSSGSETHEEASAAADTKYSNGTPIRYVVIGKQVWTADNLRVTKFSDGTPIKAAQSDADWAKAGKSRSAAYCFAGGDPASELNALGLLYNGHAITSEHGLCPKGWHIPTPEDIEALIAHVGKMPGKKLKAPFSWRSSDYGNGNGTGETGFDMTASGARNPKGRFEEVGNKGNLATSYTSGGDIDAYQLSYIGMNADKISGLMEFGLTCRCIKDSSSTTELDKANQVIPQPKVEPSEELEEDEIAD